MDCLFCSVPNEEKICGPICLREAAHNDAIVTIDIKTLHQTARSDIRK